MNSSRLLVIERSQHKKINREIYTCVSILLFAASPVQAGQAWYTHGIQLYTYSCILVLGAPTKSSEDIRIELHVLSHSYTLNSTTACLAAHCRPNSRHFQPPNPVRSRTHWPRRRSPPTPRCPPCHWHRRSNRIRWIFPPPILNGTTFCAKHPLRLCKPRATFSFPPFWAVS